MNTTTYRSNECEILIHADAADHDRGVSIEVQDLDSYRVRTLASEGFRPEVVVDIGAHIGTFGMMARKYLPSAAVHAFEPIRSHFDLLRRNVPEARAHNVAVLGFYGDETGRDIYPSNAFERALRERRKMLDDSSLAECMRSGAIDPQIHAISCRQMMELVGRPIDMLKIDCEEGEVNIFRELEELGVLGRIAIIAGEWHFETAKREVKERVARTHHVEIVEEGSWNHFFARRRV